MSEFFAMGGYAAFVWPCYAAFAVAAAALTAHAALGLRSARAELARLEAETGAGADS